MNFHTCRVSWFTPCDSGERERFSFFSTTHRQEGHSHGFHAIITPSIIADKFRCHLASDYAQMESLSEALSTTNNSH